MLIRIRARTEKNLPSSRWRGELYSAMWPGSKAFHEYLLKLWPKKMHVNP